MVPNPSSIALLGGIQYFRENKGTIEGNLVKKVLLLSWTKKLKGAPAGTPGIAGPVIQMERMRRTSWGGTPKVMVLRSTFWYDSIHGSTKKIPANQNKMLHLRLIPCASMGPKRLFYQSKLFGKGPNVGGFYQCRTDRHHLADFPGN